MAHPILMPKPGQMTEECVLVAWLKQEGDVVKKGDVLFEIETDKSTVEVEALESGILGKVLVPVGTTVPVGTAIAILIQEGEALPVSETPAAMPMAAQSKAVIAGPEPALNTHPNAFPAKVRASPAARTLAKKPGRDLGQIAGSGPGGRVGHSARRGHGPFRRCHRRRPRR